MLFAAFYLNFQHNILIFAVAYARLAIVFYMLPILGERVLSHLIIKNVIISLTIIGLWPCFEQLVSPEQGLLVILVKECVVGLILAMCLCLPFWVVIGLGEILDNQRGATISDSIDPVNGVQSSVLSGFLNFAFGAIFFAQNGMRLLMEAMAQSYRVFPRGSELKDFNWMEAGNLLMVLVQSSIMLAAPVLIILMIAEILLGVFARYCPQLNSFSLSLTIKSFIAFTVFLLYGFQALSEKPLKMFSVTMFQHFLS
ncbi:type III secretion system export apparatus subunit SctT [Pectobacterium parvum]|uniref:EscT/YscT/HrcT family type III secretion system export apparatus protein n=1 Tax=Pectobacterium parvum TaxID=2778550 RepID=A0AAP9LC44_9GAMM|nr:MULTISPECIES: type III secretion system export apparatus subunit SctT [Pectobacterium]UHK02625.1 SctT [Pectobacterium carotovorum subsp. carotovorum]QHQ23264.1 EscT/YscT/HrcT family type III secretion system export apparatus protein [Pectobacterium parvum]UFK38927.1 type III secretion system export apparatus subunit SctT [Pectobacterium parvum]UVD97048.1 type III secretion system export apparatus subunit SctT [Pectobacterium parvum]GKW40841.1 EscT/YscT/HrcT family type III secretion system 